MTAIGERRFGRINWLGLATLIRRETQRFMAVWTQTVAAPIVTGALFMVIFSIAIGPRRGDVAGVPFAQFIAPGIVMMTVIQNAFANTSSSIMIAKIQGNIVDTLMPPLSAAELLAGYVLGGTARGVLVAVVTAAVIFPFVGLGVAEPLTALVFVVLGSVLMALLGIVAAILAQKFDQLAAITNFVITPLSFLSGTFYSVQDLPGPMAAISHANPIFYLIDGVRHGILGTSDAAPWLGALVALAWCLGLGALCWHWLRTGYRLKS